MLGELPSGLSNGDPRVTELNEAQELNVETGIHH